jgi:hypothetical protein
VNGAWLEHTTTMSAIDELIPRLHRVRRALQRAVLERRIASTVSVVILCLVVMAIADRMLRFPTGLRWTTLILGLAWLGWSIRTYIWSAIRFRPTLVDVALRIESSAPPLVGRLASGVEFATSGVGDTNPLAARTLRDLQHRVSSVRFEEIIDARRAHQLLAVAVCACALMTTLVIWRPVDASIATRRVLAPWTDARWPARTEVAGLLDTDLVHARGEPLEMAAELVRGDLENDRVFLNIRNIRDGVRGDWQRLVLTRQQGRRFERIIDTDADEIEYTFSTDEVETPSSTIRLFPAPQISAATATVTPPAYASSRGEIRAELGPGTDRRSRLTEPVLEGSDLQLDLVLNRPVPIVRSDDGSVSRDFIEQTVIVPDEARVDLQINSTDPTRWRVLVSMDRGGDIGLSLLDEYGLRNIDPIRYRVDTIPDRAPTTTISRPVTDQTVSVDAVVEVQAEARDDVRLKSFEIEATLVRGGVDSHVESIAALAVDTTEDSAADATLRVDFGVADLKPEVGDEILLVAIASDEYLVSEVPRAAVRSIARRLRVVSSIDLAEQLQSALSSIRRSAIRLDQDQGGISDAVRRGGPSRSSVREQGRLGDRIASARDALESIEQRRNENRLDDEMLEEIIEQAQDLLEAASEASESAVASLDEAAREKSSSGTGGESTTSEPSDTEAGAGPEDQGSSEEGVERDRTEDTEDAEGAEGGEGAEGTADSSDAETSDAASSAQTPTGETSSNTEPTAGSPTSNSEESASSDQSGQPAEPNESGEPQPSSSTTQAEQDAIEAQDEVRAELADLAELLDRGEDAWVVSRKIQQMAEDLAGLQERTSELAEETMGRDRSELTPEERRELDDIAREQGELADDADELVEELEERGASLDQIDPAQAAGLREAARDAREQGLEEQMREAEQEARENRLQQAGEAQQQAADALERMQETIEESRKAQVAELQRRIASLVDSLLGLIKTSENEIIALARIEGPADVQRITERARALVTLNGNTIAVAAEAAAAGSSGERISRLIERAGRNQGAAIGDLRADPVQIEDSRANQERALSALREAMVIAEEAAEQLAEEQAAERRNALLAAYAGVLETQIGIRIETEKIRPLVGERLGRRGLVTARRLATDESQLGSDLESIQDEFEEITDSLVFSMTHRNIDAWVESAATRLRDGRPDIETIERQTMIIEAIAGLAAALDQEQQDDDPFAEPEDGGGDGEQAGGEQGEQPPDPLIPPIAELKMLRSTQQQILDATRRLDAARTLDPSTDTRDRIGDLARLQADLHAVATALLDQLQPATVAPPEGGPEKGPDR